MENKIRDIFIQCLVFNKTIIPLTFVGNEQAYDSWLSDPHLIRYLEGHIQHFLVPVQGIFLTTVINVGIFASMFL